MSFIVVVKVNQRFVMLPDKTCIEFFVTNLVIYCFNSHGFLLSFFYAVVKINQWQAFNDFCRPEKNYSPPKLAITTNDLNNNWIPNIAYFHMNFCSRKYAILRFLLSAKAKKTAVYTCVFILQRIFYKLHCILMIFYRKIHSPEDDCN